MQAAKGVELHQGPEHMWRAVVELPLLTKMEAKIVVVKGGKEVWEGGDNRILHLQPHPGAAAAAAAGGAAPDGGSGSGSGGTGKSSGGVDDYIVMAHWGSKNTQVIYRSRISGGCPSFSLACHV